jgi:hypothetical protein
MKKQLYKILVVFPEDALYPYRYTFIDQTGYLDGVLEGDIFSGTFTYTKPLKKLGVLRNVGSNVFLKIQVEKVV